MNEPKPLPCPFCGSEPSVEKFEISCVELHCPARPVRVRSCGGESPIPGWNTRHTSEIPNLWGDLSELMTKKNEQLEEDIGIIQVGCPITTDDMELYLSAIARTILHLLKR